MKYFCDQCGVELSLGAAKVITSPVGLALWNALHPYDRREALYTCTTRCTFTLGSEMGRAALARPGGRALLERLGVKDRPS